MKTLRVLYIEDSLDDQIILKRLLQKSMKIPFQVETVNSGIEGLKRIGKKRFDLIILDYKMPKMTGLEFLGEMHKLGIEIPVIFVTSKGNEKIAVKAMKKGVRDYIVKDEIDANRLMETIKDIVLEWSLPKGIDIEAVKHLDLLFTHSPTIEVEVINTSRTNPKSTISITELISTLKKLAKIEYIDTKPLRSTIVCPFCNSLHSILGLLCPECSDNRLIKGDLVEHISCEGMNLKDWLEFERIAQARALGELICRKCGRKVSQIEKDYKKVGSWYKCLNQHFFDIPDLRFKCPDCGKDFDLESAKLDILKKYELNKRGQQQLRLNLLKHSLTG